MNWWGRLVWILIAVLVIAVLVYRIFDLAVSLDYARQEAHIQREQVAFLRGLLRQTAHGMTRAQVERLIGEYGKDEEHIVRRHDDRVEIDGVVFVFEGDSVVAISFGDEGATLNQ